MSYNYADEYLAPLVTAERQRRAEEDVDAIKSDYPEENRDRLVVLRAYIIVCLDCGTSADDVFAHKLKQYRTEFGDELVKAEAALKAKEGESPAKASLFSIEIDRA